MNNNFASFKSEIISGKNFLEIFDKYFHDDADMYEGGELKDNRKGKAKNREYQVQFLTNAKINDIKINRSISEGDTVAYEMLMDFEFGGQHIKKTQWVIQTWKDGLIIKEEYL